MNKESITLTKEDEGFVKSILLRHLNGKSDIISASTLSIKIHKVYEAYLPSLEVYIDWENNANGFNTMTYLTDIERHFHYLRPDVDYPLFLKII